MKESNIIIEGNKLISNFMELVVNEEPIRVGGIKVNDTYDSLHYHDNWEWLMPVVIKIESTQGMSIRVEISGYICEIYQTKRNPAIKENGGFQDISLVSEKHNDKLALVWMSVVQFIKWYNQQPKDK